MPTRTSATTAPVDPAAARLHGSRSQRAFAVLLDALARPGTVATLDGVGLPDSLPPALVVPLALADVEVSVAVLGRDAAMWERLVVDATGTRSAESSAASMVVALDGIDAATVLSLRRGTAESPEGGARLALACRRVRAVDLADDAATDPDEIVLALRGPGVPGVRHIAVGGVPAVVLDAISTANAVAPAGVDTWLVSPVGDVVGLPRSTRLSLADLPEVR